MEMETQKRKDGKKYITLATVLLFCFVHSWLGCYMPGRGETEYCSCSTYIIVQSISSPFEHCVFCSVVEH